MKYPTMAEAETAAELLGMDVFDLALALQQFATRMFESAIPATRDYEMPNFGRGRRAMMAAISCEQAWSETTQARLAEDISA